MAVAHIIALLVFVCIGGIGLAAIQEGLSEAWGHWRINKNHLKKAATTYTKHTPVKDMKISVQ